MHEAALAEAPGADLFIGAAAVADYRAQHPAPEKMKKSGNEPLTLALIQNPDIIASVSLLENRPTVVVGFAAETSNLIEHARAKRISKKLDLIVANDVSAEQTGFGSEQNAVHLIAADEEQYLTLASKQVIAEQIIAVLAKMLGATPAELQQESH